MSDAIEVRGMDHLLAKLREMENAPAILGQAALAAATELKGKIAKYPKSTEANQPGRFSIKTHRLMGWYKRGEGAVTPGGRHLRNSQRLNQSWTVSMRGGDSIVIGTSVSYAPFVQGNKQAWFHQMRGWVKAKDAAEANLDVVVRKMSAALRRLING